MIRRSTTANRPAARCGSGHHEAKIPLLKLSDPRIQMATAPGVLAINALSRTVRGKPSPAAGRVRCRCKELSRRITGRDYIGLKAALYLYANGHNGRAAEKILCADAK
jgi:hypothetical protein